MGNFKEDIVKTEAFVFDVDGVFTDGGITPFGDDFIRRYYAKDGYAVSYASKLGYKICIITGGRGKWLQERFERLRVTKIYADCADKIATTSPTWSACARSEFRCARRTPRLR